MMATMAAAQVNRIRDYEQADAPAIARLFYETVRAVNRADYSEEQVRAWAPAIPDAGEWHDRVAGRRTLVADEGGEVSLFALGYWVDNHAPAMPPSPSTPVGRPTAAGGANRRPASRVDRVRIRGREG